jgi:hypothetical protein
MESLPVGAEKVNAISRANGCYADFDAVSETWDTA